MDRNSGKKTYVLASAVLPLSLLISATDAAAQCRPGQSCVVVPTQPVQVVRPASPAVRPVLQVTPSAAPPATLGGMTTTTPQLYGSPAVPIPSGSSRPIAPLSPNPYSGVVSAPSSKSGSSATIAPTGNPFSAVVRTPASQSSPITNQTSVNPFTSVLPPRAQSSISATNSSYSPPTPKPFAKPIPNYDGKSHSWQKYFCFPS
jgi:hypothetical protein